MIYNGSQKKLLVPTNNTRAYQFLFCIENGIRELIISSLDKLDPHWWKTRIPGDLLDDLKKSRQIEKNCTWSSLTTYPPIYYVEFPELRKVIEKNDNWKDVFKNYFHDKDVFVGQFRAIEPIRNKIAHNRLISDEDMTLLMGFYSLLLNTLGNDYFEALLSSTKKNVNIHQELSELQKYFISCTQKIIECQPINFVERLVKIESNWWFDSYYLNTDISPIIEFNSLLKEYYNRIRYRGDGYITMKWVEENRFLEKFEFVNSSLSILLDSNKQ